MARIAVEGMRRGRWDFSTSRTINHKTKAGVNIPTLDADEAELAAIASALHGINAGWLQVISDFDDPAPEFAMLRRLVAKSGRPMAITILQRDNKPEEWREITGWIADANRSGLPMLGQVLTRPTGIILGFEISQNPFLGRPSFDAVADLPFEAKIAELRSRNAARRSCRRKRRTTVCAGAFAVGTACFRCPTRPTTSRRRRIASPPVPRACTAIRRTSPMRCCWRTMAEGVAVPAVVELHVRKSRYGS